MTPRRHALEALVGGVSDPRDKIPSKDLDDPYQLNRPERPARGKRPLIPKEVEGMPEGVGDVPTVTAITLHTMVKESIQDKEVLLGAISAFSAVSRRRRAGEPYLERCGERSRK